MQPLRDWESFPIIMKLRYLNPSGKRRTVGKIGTLPVLLASLIGLLMVTGKVFGQQMLQPLPVLNPAEVKLVEGVSFCSVGFGTQTVAFQIENQTVYSEKVSSPFLPSFDFFQPPYLRLGCNLKNIVIDFSFYENSLKFNQSIQYRGTEYNVIQFKTNSLAVGYSFSLVPHSLYLDVGVGYIQTQYSMDFENNGALRKDDSIAESDAGTFYRLNLSLFVSAHIYFQWLNQQAFDTTTTVTYTNQLGINYLVRL